MKKPLLLCVLALSLTSCDILSSLTGLSKKDSESEKEKLEHEGVALNLSCSDDLGLKRAEDTNYVTDLSIEPQSVGATTIKRLDGHITFYMPPVYGEAQLREIDEDSHPDYLFVETQIEFAQADDKPIDFVYLTDIDFSCNDQSDKIYQNLRVAIFNKDTHEDCYVLSYDKNGSSCKTEYNLDLNKDDKLDSYDNMFDNTETGLISYTTGLPYYYTDVWANDIPTQREIESDQFDPHHQRLSFIDTTPITIRMWVEGWELENNDVVSDLQIDINLKFGGHY